MKRVLCKVAVLAAVLSIVAEVPTSAKPAKPSSPPAAVTLPAAGTFAGGGEFTGTITVNRFERTRDNHIVAVGLVTGVLKRSGQTLGSAVVGQMTWPVAVKVGGVLLAGGSARQPGTPLPVAWSPDARSTFGMRRVQAEACQVVDIALGPVNLDVLGLQVALSPVTVQPVGGYRHTARRPGVCRVRPARQRGGAREPLE